MAGVGGEAFTAAGIEDGLGKNGDGRELDGEAGEEGGAGGAGDGFMAVNVALGLVEADTFGQGLDGMPQEGRSGKRTKEGIAQRTAVGHGRPLEAAKAFLTDLGEQRLEGAQALEVEIAVEPAVAEQEFVAQDVGLHRKALRGVEGGMILHVESSGIGIPPELVMPAGMMAAPACDPRFGLRGKGLRAKPDLVDEPGEAGGKG